MAATLTTPAGSPSPTSSGRPGRSVPRQGAETADEDLRSMSTHRATRPQGQVHRCLLFSCNGRGLFSGRPRRRSPYSTRRRLLRHGQIDELVYQYHRQHVLFEDPDRRRQLDSRSCPLEDHPPSRTILCRFSSQSIEITETGIVEDHQQPKQKQTHLVRNPTIPLVYSLVRRRDRIVAAWHQWIEGEESPREQTRTFSFDGIVLSQRPLDDQRSDPRQDPAISSSSGIGLLQASPRPPQPRHRTTRS